MFRSTETSADQRELFSYCPLVTEDEPHMRLDPLTSGSLVDSLSLARSLDLLPLSWFPAVTTALSLARHRQGGPPGRRLSLKNN